MTNDELFGDGAKDPWADRLGDKIREIQGSEDYFILAHPFLAPCICLNPSWPLICRCNCHLEGTGNQRICWAVYEKALVNGNSDRLR